jgi:hypothetical protein
MSNYQLLEHFDRWGLSVNISIFSRPRWSSGNVPVFGPKIRGSKPGRERWILWAIEIRSTTSF